MKVQDIRLLVTLHGASASVTVERLRPVEPAVHGPVLVQGRSFNDVMKAIEAAALESQGRKAE